MKNPRKMTRHFNLTAAGLTLRFAEKKHGFFFRTQCRF